MSIFENFEKKLQAEPKSIVFTEGTDARILSAASRLLGRQDPEGHPAGRGRSRQEGRC